MKTEKLTIIIETISESRIRCIAENTSCRVAFDYFPDQNTLNFEVMNSLSHIISEYQFQFEKVIRSALKGKLDEGHKINCVFIDGFKFLDEADYNAFIRLDRRGGDFKVSTSDKECKCICKIFTDGSFVAETGTSGYGGIIQHNDGEREVFSQSFAGGASNLMELRAVLDGLKRLQDLNEIQINTDSRFVIRGMVQWMHFWRHNGWQTAHGSKVKYADYWKELYALSEEKFIEFRWIKGHSGHHEQDFCHKLAKKSAGISFHR